MALKDWKEDSSNYPRKTWKKKGDKYKLILDEDYRGETFFVHGFYSSPRFKDRETALKFAKQYMRTH